MIKKSATSQFRNNLAANLTYFVCNAGIALWLVPYLIDHLGIAVYGLVPLAVSLTAYVGLISHSFNSAVGRFLTIELHSNDSSEANRTFNTAFFAGIGLVILAVPLGLSISVLAPSFLEVPAGHHSSSRIFFGGVLLAFVLSTFRSTFSVAAFSRNRIDLVVALQALELTVRTVLIVAAVEVLMAPLGPLGACYLAGATGSLVASVYVWRAMTPQLHINVGEVDRSRLRDLFGMGGWVAVNQVGSLLFLNIDLIVVNKLFGTDSGGQYAALLPWVFLLRSMSGMIIGMLTPTVFILHGRGERDQLVAFCRNSVKLIGIVIALPVGLICGLAPALLRVWLGPKFEPLGPLLVLLVAHLSINIAARPLFGVQQALNQVRLPGTVTLLAGILNLVLAISLPLLFGWGLFGVAAAGAIALSIKNAVFTPWYAAHMLSQPWHRFFSALVPGALCTSAVASLSWSASRVVQISGWHELLLSSAVLVVAYLAVVYFLVLSSGERRMVKSLVHG